MSRIVHHEGWVDVVEPYEAGQYDPTMQDWLALPVSEDGCPSCGSQHWGTVNARGYFLVRRCHDERGIGCGEKFRGAVTPHVIENVVSALVGTPRRFGTSQPDFKGGKGSD